MFLRSWSKSLIALQKVEPQCARSGSGRNMSMS